MPDEKLSLPIPGLRWRGFTLQLFLVTILPLTVLVLAFVIISQSLHHQAMTEMVGDRDLRAIRAAAQSLDEQFAQRALSLQFLAANIPAGVDLSAPPTNIEPVIKLFDGGLTLFTPDGQVISTNQPGISWEQLPIRHPELWQQLLQQSPGKPWSAPLIFQPNETSSYAWIGVITGGQNVLVAGYQPAKIIGQTLSGLQSSEKTTLMVVDPAYQLVYHGGGHDQEWSPAQHPGVEAALRGDSGVDIYPSGHGDHVIAFSRLESTGWAIVLEETWEDIASPTLSTTQSAPLILIPLLVLALAALWFGARQIVQPLQKLAAQSEQVARGDFQAIRKPVGGIAEIQALQERLIATSDDLQAAQEAQRNYIGSITAGIENERRSLARELHDDTLQALIALNQRLQLASPATSEASLQPMVQQAMMNLRRMVRGLRPIYLEDLGLDAALEMLAKETRQTTNLAVHFQVRGTARRLNNDTELALYRIAQEALNNVQHHAQANQAWIELDFQTNSVKLTIRDDGCGFNPPANRDQFAREGHFGLLGFYERADLLGARLEIQTAPGQGCQIQLEINTHQQPTAPEALE